MKQGIHPKYETITVTCSCGNTFETKSTVDAINVEICSSCHPFFTGKQKLVDTAGRVDKFRMKMEASQKLKANATEKTPRVKKDDSSSDIKEIAEELKSELVENTETTTQES